LYELCSNSRRKKRGIEGPQPKEKKKKKREPVGFSAPRRLVDEKNQNRLKKEKGKTSSVG